MSEKIKSATSIQENVALNKNNRFKQSDYNTNQNKIVNWRPNETKETKLTRHRIYDRLLWHLENKEIRSATTGNKLPFILHENTKKALRGLYGFSDSDIVKNETSTLRDAEQMNHYRISQDVPINLFYECERQGDAEFIVDNRIVAIPNSITNTLICAALGKEFSRKEILAVAGFVVDTRRDETGFTHRSIRLDVDEKHCRRGFIVPVIYNRLIDGLKIYRRPNDEKPFLLRSRVGGLRW